MYESSIDKLCCRHYPRFQPPNSAPPNNPHHPRDTSRSFLPSLLHNRKNTLAPSDARPATYRPPRTPRSRCRCHKQTQRRRHRQPTQRRPPPSPAVPPPPQLYPGATAAVAAAAPVMPACSPASKRRVSAQGT
ncbi:hypothetical protein I4F81_010964 [Pyropia yezoensis]|uniref:Uncharacterized protein n=1 Tax=Pyropia yezoensis TaxID=2788 RepID=A0ACC3CEH1_PYRYE|nr:hypothetical protein I4F81_010964 [Neopyropia yezoensis]